MKVNPNRDLAATATRLAQAKKPERPAKPAATDFPATAALNQKLEMTPEVRAEKVARAKALIADPNYPDDATVRAVANTLAGKIRPKSGK